MNYEILKGFGKNKATTSSEDWIKSLPLDQMERKDAILIADSTEGGHSERTVYQKYRYRLVAAKISKKYSLKIFNKGLYLVKK